MTQDEVIKLAKQAGCINEDWLENNVRFLTNLINLVTNVEREACAVTAWSHFMSECKRKRIPPSEFESWLAAGVIRSRNN